jgi:hypothetical protein
MKERSKEIGVSDLFHNTVFGDNATIIIGDSNSQKIRNTVIKNDLASLQQLLREKGLSENDVSDLAEAIQADEDSSEISKESFGKNVSLWIGKMVSKAATTAWDIKVGAAGSLLAKAIGKFYGF